MITPRTGATRVADVPPDILAQLNAGTLATATLAEGLAIDFAQLAATAVPELGADGVAHVRELAGRGITQRMQGVAVRLLAVGDPAATIARLAAHPSDTVRGWACYLIALSPHLKKLKPRLDLIRPLADDPHFGVREWAWLAMRPHVIDSLAHYLKAVQLWTAAASAHVRRFAVESTRPRGVWSTHIEQLKQNPDLGRPLLDPLRADPSEYVQDSVANWLNDAAKSKPDWVRAVCREWLAASPTTATERICKRALRSVK